MLKKLRSLWLGLPLLLAVSFAQAADNQGTVTQIYVGDVGVYGCPVSGTCYGKVIVYLSDGVGYIFKLNGDVARAWLTELTAAKANGQTVQLWRTSATKDAESGSAYYQVLKMAAI
jgi:hypothetical protein